MLLLEDLFKLLIFLGIIRSVGSLKNARLQTLKIFANDQRSGRIIDEIILFIECKNFMELAPKFQKKIYEFDINRRDATYNNADPIGQVQAFVRNTNTLTYEVLDLETDNRNNENLPIIIDDKVSIIINFYNYFKLLYIRKLLTTLIIACNLKKQF